MKRIHSGFTLVELMIVVAIVAILAAVAYPSYLNQTQKTRRSAAQAWLMTVSTYQQQWWNDTRTTNCNAATTWPAPNEVSSYYTITVGTAGGACVATSALFTLTATPIAGTSQVGDGALTLDSTGAKTPVSKW